MAASAEVEIEQNGEGSPTTAAVLRVAAGSANPAKIRAVEQALRQAVKRAAIPVEIQVQGYGVESGVADQPFGDDETCAGAKNRAQEAYRAYRIEHGKSPHLAVGMEGGLQWGDEGDKLNLYCMAWMALYGKREAVTVQAFACANVDSYPGDKKPVYGTSKTAMFPVPDKVTALVKEGVELGDADDIVFKRHKSKHGSGLIGLLTDDLIDRSLYYEHAILMALIPWIQPHLYPEGN